MNDEIEKAIAIGEENRDLIVLGKSWCTNIRTDRSGFGVGMVEEMTGLPITGGRFACDHAREPGGIVGMRLEVSAVGFYEANCVGCEARVPGERVPNLSTWAEPRIRQRRENEERRAASRTAEAAERDRRAGARRLLAAPFSAAAQEVVELINALDGQDANDHAAESLRAIVQLSPEVFDEPLQAVLIAECRSLRSSVLLDAAVNLQEANRLSDASGVHALAVDAVTAGWATSPGARHLAREGQIGDICDELLDALVHHSATGRSAGFHFGSRRGEPAALLHYHRLDAPSVERRVSLLLGHGDAWRRSNAAEAAASVMDCDAEAGLRLLPALLDSLKHPDGLYRGEGSAHEVNGVVGKLLVMFADDVDRAVEHRWGRATPAYRYKLLSCYDSVFRSSRGTDRHPEVARAAIGRAIGALNEPDIGTSEIGEDYQRVAVDVLKMAIPGAEDSDLSLDSLLGVLLEWIGRASAIAAAEPQSEMQVLERMGASARADGIVRGLSEAVAIACTNDPLSALSVCQDVYGSEAVDAEVRAEVVRVVGRVIASAPDATSQALPTIYSAVLGDHHVVRSAGIEAAGAAIRSLGPESIPPLLAEAVFAGLSDNYLIVVSAAVEVVHRFHADLLPMHDATVRLLLYAKAYSSDRLRTRSVQEAFRGALRFASRDPAFCSMVARSILNIIDDMPAYEAREALSGLHELRYTEGWVATAIQAMRPDDDYQYEHLGDREKEFLLTALGSRQLTDDELDELLTVESAADSVDRERALMFADVFAESLRPDLGERVMARHLDAIPETTELRGLRRVVRLQLLRYAMEAAIAESDTGRSHDIFDEMTQIVEERDGQAEYES